jgi:hypothetical protein
VRRHLAIEAVVHAQTQCPETRCMTAQALIARGRSVAESTVLAGAMAVTSCAGPSPGLSWRSSAISPLTWAAANEVPETSPQLPSA